MGPDDILNGVHMSFFILFVRTGFPRIGGTSPHVAFRFELLCKLSRVAMQNGRRKALFISNGVPNFARVLANRRVAPGFDML
jgi:hypothetical protein